MGLEVAGPFGLVEDESPNTGDSAVAPKPRRPRVWVPRWPYAVHVSVLVVLIGLLLWAIAVLLGPDQAFLVGAVGTAGKLVCMATESFPCRSRSR